MKQVFLHNTFSQTGKGSWLEEDVKQLAGSGDDSVSRPCALPSVPWLLDIRPAEGVDTVALRLSYW